MQRRAFESLCNNTHLKSYTPLYWSGWARPGIFCCHLLTKQYHVRKHPLQSYGFEKKHVFTRYHDIASDCREEMTSVRDYEYACWSGLSIQDANVFVIIDPGPMLMCGLWNRLDWLNRRKINRTLSIIRRTGCCLQYCKLWGRTRKGKCGEQRNASAGIITQCSPPTDKH